jgi:hypothetical protein
MIPAAHQPNPTAVQLNKVQRRHRLQRQHTPDERYTSQFASQPLFTAGGWCGDTHITSHPLPQSIGSALYSSDLSCSIHLSHNQKCPIIGPQRSLAPPISVSHSKNSPSCHKKNQYSSSKPCPPGRSTDQWRSRRLGKVAYKRRASGHQIHSSSNGETSRSTSEEGRIPGSTSGRTTRLTVLKKRRNSVATYKNTLSLPHRAILSCHSRSDRSQTALTTWDFDNNIYIYVSCTFSPLEKTAGAPHNPMKNHYFLHS